MLQATAITKTYRAGDDILRDVSLELGEGETLAVVGPSGCGKTTLLYLLSGLSRPDAGLVTLDGREITSPTPEISIILQDYGLLPWRTVGQNVALGLKIRGVSARDRRAMAAEQLAALGMAGREGEYPGNLSGGEKQRVAIARAFACRPRYLLMDEPFSSLDALTRERLQQILLDIWSRSHVPYVLVTHSLEEAAFLGRRILVLTGRPSQVTARFDNPFSGDPDLRQRTEYFDLLRALRRSLEGKA